MKRLDQSALFPVEGWQSMPLPSATVRLWCGWLGSAEATALYEQLAASLQWVTIAGKTHPIPRLQAWYGDAGSVYRYSGTTFVPHAWTAGLDDLRSRVETVCEARFNSVLVNWYRHGADGMGFHADNEPELGPQPVIASLSLGGTRRFVLKPQRGLDVESLAINLGDGDLLEMSGQTQHRWHHGVPKTANRVVPRINLTFRLILPV